MPHRNVWKPVGAWEAAEEEAEEEDAEADGEDGEARPLGPAGAAREREARSACAGCWEGVLRQGRDTANLAIACLMSRESRRAHLHLSISKEVRGAARPRGARVATERGDTGR